MPMEEIKVGQNRTFRSDHNNNDSNNNINNNNNNNINDTSSSIVVRDRSVASGFLPNIFKIMSYDPKSFKYFFGYYDHLVSDRGNLTKADKALISLSVSTENKCLYCTVSHRVVFRLSTDDPVLTDQLTVNWKTADLTDRQRAIVELAMAVTKNEPITEEHFTNLEQHGLDQRDAFDIGHYAAFFALANRIAVFTKLRPNDEFSD
ncbi:putative uncharacterized transmembrane protein DDB_G0290641 [Lytechinus variegatus]|uniref:putative uncharacterized transmembrane protein DDB_G0290641 n=1 Tax=Lytechinus variegatus TaxID=7654 RepID=UPI001BB19686|nr:putative uncharacterized transmembrane protein DDB_G0290641 [Lytechinus variegatus]